MPTLGDYARHSAFTDPGHHGDLLATLPATIDGVCEAVRNVIVHYRAAGIPFPDERLLEIQSRWVSRILDVDQRRHHAPLAAPRAQEQRVAGCCRDFTLLTVAGLRQHGIPARSRIGFAGYFVDGFHHDHVIVEHWDGTGWHSTDAQLEPGAGWSIDPADVPRVAPGETPAGRVFATAAQVWAAYRAGEVDIDSYGVDPDLPIRGEWMVGNYVVIELAHRHRDELLLWDEWGAMRAFEPVSAEDLVLLDEIAALLIAADGGDGSAERELAARYAADDRLRPGAALVSHSPLERDFAVDLVARTETPVAPAAE